MSLLINLILASLHAVLVFQLVDHTSRSHVPIGDDDDLVRALRAPDPGAAAVCTFLFSLCGPYFLYRSRGWRGALEGVLLLFGLFCFAIVLRVTAIIAGLG